MGKLPPQEIDFLSPVSLVQGIGPRRAAALKKSGIETIGDLLYHFPRRYIDRSKVVPLASIERFRDSTCTVMGVIKKAYIERGRRGRLRALLTDETGSIELLWFAGIPQFKNLIRQGALFVVTGRVGFYRHFQMTHPMVEQVRHGDRDAPVPCLPIYPISETMRDAGISHRLISRAVFWALDHCTHFPNPLPAATEKKRSFPPLQQCLWMVHRPDLIDKLDTFTARLRYEELYRLALTLRWSRRAFANPGRAMHDKGLADRFRAVLPFRLTEDQEKAIRVLNSDAASQQRMHRLLQGDVGSGKTLVAFFACLPALASGLQVAWLSPTAVLAKQTWRLVSEWLKTFDMAAVLLRGGMQPVQKREMTEGISSGVVRFVVGTHALLQPVVRFARLGMIVIDEQHKFGVEQRLSLQEKDTASDFLLMSATPIPQTLAQTLYGDLDVVTIEKPPQGRLPVASRLVPEEKRTDMERFIREKIVAQGGAVYWVVPRIEQDETAETAKDARSTYELLSKGPFKGIALGCLHGQLSDDEKDSVIQSFVSGAIRILVTTTVIEVGIDIPHASCMVIENAERFGMAQLHQLRGRIGRSGQKSWCLLLSPLAADSDIFGRLNYFCSHADGFDIAEKDLEIRGPGETGGFRQTGWDDLIMADIIRDAGLFREIQEEIEHPLLP
jgi:ATP-dependent DNA helicase RecG